MQKTTISHLLLLASALIFGVNYWVSKWLTTAIDVQTIVMLRVIGSGILFWILSFFVVKESLKIKDHLLLAGAAFMGIALNQIFFFSGIHLSNPVDVSIIHVTNPLFVLILSALFIKSKITTPKIAGLVFGAAGALILILKSGQMDFSKDTLRGNLLIVANTISYAAYLVISKPLLNRLKTTTVMKWISLWGIVFVLPFGFQSMIATNYSEIVLNTWLSLIYLIIIVTFLAYLFSAYALKNLSTTIVSFYIYLQPLIVASLAIVIGTDKPSLYHLVAAIFIFVGVYFVSKGKLPIGRKKKLG